MPLNAPPSALRRALDDQLARALDEFEPQLIDRVQSDLGDSLNQAMRRMRQASDAAEILATLLDASSPFSKGAAVLRIQGDSLVGVRIRGVDAAASGQFASLEFPLASAAALAGAAESQDPVVAVYAPGEVSPALASILGEVPGARISIFPIPSAGVTKALLCCWGAGHGSTLELLAQAAGLALPVEPPPAPPPPPELVAIAPAPREAAPSKPRAAWEALPEDEQRVHLRAQRFARVQAAEIRLHYAEAVHAGRIHRDIYGALRDEIDTAREKFHRGFIATCPSMVDYLHLELIRTLANDNVALMGSEFPGPLE